MNTQITEVLNKAKLGQRLNTTDAKRLLQAKGADIYPILAVAHDKKIELKGQKVSYINNYNLNLTNICINNCRFCGFNTDPDNKDGYLISEEELVKEIKFAKEKEVSEICFVSGLHPEFELEDYQRIIKKIKKIYPEVHLHGITPEELEHGLRNSDLDFKTGYQILKESGLDSVPGTAAEILVPAVRERICPEKISTQQWLKAIKAAHEVGLKSTATIMYGHLESIEQRVRHLDLIRQLQDETAGFSEFIPLSFIHQNTELAKSGLVNSGASGREDILMIAVSRLFLDNIANIQASWVKYGPKLAQLMLTAGANDLGGTLFNENISRQAGKDTAEYLAPAKIKAMIRDIGAKPKQRTTLYKNQVQTTQISAEKHKNTQLNRKTD